MLALGGVLAPVNAVSNTLRLMIAGLEKGEPRGGGY